MISAGKMIKGDMDMAYGIDRDRIPARTLRGGERIPCLGLGTFGSDKYGPEEIAEAVYGDV